MKDYLCAKFGDFSFSRLVFIVLTDRITEADERYSHATTVVVSIYSMESVKAARGKVISRVSHVDLYTSRNSIHLPAINVTSLLNKPGLTTLISASNTF